MAVTHPFTSGVADGDDDSLVQPSDWNADHDVELDAADIDFTPTGTIAATNVQNAIAEVASEGGAPSSADYLVGTANGSLSAEIVVGTSPGGELGGTWASPTVDATHAGTTHSAATDTHIADTSAAHAASAVSADSTTLVGTGTDVQAVLEDLDNAVVATETVANNAVTKNGGGKETLETHGNTGGTETINLANGNVHDITTDSTPCVLTFSGSTAAVACSFTLIVRQGTGGSKTVTWPASVDWPGGTTPTLTTAAGSVDVFTFVTVDNGTTWLGFTAGLDVK